MLSDFLDVFFLLNQLKFCMWPLIHEKNIALHFFLPGSALILQEKTYAKKPLATFTFFLLESQTIETHQLSSFLNYY